MRGRLRGRPTRALPAQSRAQTCGSPRTACAATPDSSSSAIVAPAPRKISAGWENSERPSHPRARSIPPPDNAAAWNSGAKRARAAIAKCSPWRTVSSAEAGESRAAATSTAPSHVSHRESGENPTLTSGWPSEPVGSYTATGPIRERCPALARMSPLVDVTSAGPAHAASVGAITLRVLPAFGGPTMIAALPGGERSTPSSAWPAQTLVPAIDGAVCAIHGSSGAAGGSAGAPLGLLASLMPRMTHTPPVAHATKLAAISSRVIMASAGVVVAVAR
jgi:hypothetical protein